MSSSGQASMEFGMTLQHHTVLQPLGQTSLDVAQQGTKRKRASHCTELDNYKGDIEFWFGHENWTAKKIRDHLEENCGLKVNEKQIRGRLEKWGIRKRLTTEEYWNIATNIRNREAAGKESQAIVKGSACKSPRSLKRGLDRAMRNISFTEQLFRRSAGQLITNNAPFHPEVQIMSPPTLDSLALASSPRKITVSILNRLPIKATSDWLGRSLQTFLSRRYQTNLAISNIQAQPYYASLRAIIYKLSNDTFRIEEMLKLLEEVDNLRCRDPLKALLSANTISMRFACENVADALFIKGDYDFLDYIYSLHPHICVHPVRALHFFEGPTSDREFAYLQQAAKTIRDSRMEKVFPGKGTWFSSLPILAKLPEASDFLKICRCDLRDISIFFDTWDPATVAVDKIEEFTAKYLQLREMPLADVDFRTLDMLLSAGFRCCATFFLLRAAIRNETHSVSVFLKHLYPAVEAPDFFSPGGPQRNIWELFEGTHFREMISQATAELDDYFSTHHDDNSDPIEIADVHVMLCLATMNPESFDFIVEQLCIQYSTSSPKLLQAVASDLIHYFIPIGSRYWVLQSIHNTSDTSMNQLVLLRELVERGVDFNQTAFWKQKIWQRLWQLLPKRPKYTTRPIQFDKYRVYVEAATIILEAGFSVNFNVDVPSLAKRAQDGSPGGWSLIPRSGHLTPIEIAFALPTSDLFETILFSSIPQHTFPTDSTLKIHLGVRISPWALEAIKDGNLDRLKHDWDTRFEFDNDGPKTHIISALEGGDFEAAAALYQSPNIKNTDKIKWLSDIACAIERGRTDSSKLSHLLNSIADSLSDLKVHRELETDKRQWKYYKKAISSAIRMENPRLLAALLKNGPNSERLWELKCKEMVNALDWSFGCLEVLVEDGVDINRQLSDGTRYIRTLERAVGNGDLRAAIYLLEHGADMFLINYWGLTAVEWAVIRGKIDIVSLFLEVDPTCQMLALKVAEEGNKVMMAEHIRKWRPRSERLEDGVEISQLEAAGLPASHCQSPRIGIEP
ncbi:hypothetical protein ABW19_dt0207361 [Dactylella cylindrospora]|nr:hypothetical protein ABW19_dt0207361 [Dactylella cylindrospora]